MSNAAVTPTPNQAQPAAAVPMQFSDGSQAMVPKEKVVDAMYDGGELLHPMKFPDGSQAMVAHSKLAGAMKDGGQRLDTQPIPAATWQQYVGSAFGAATDTTLGAETGEKSLGQDVTQGLNEASSGHPVKGAARVAGAVATAASPAAGMSSLAGDSGQFVDAAATSASSLPAPSLKSLFKIASTTARDAEVASGTVESGGAKEFADLAYRGAAQARQAGNTTKALAYDAAALAAKGYGKFSAASTWLDKTVPGLPIAFKAWAVLHLAKEGFDAVFGDDKEDARETIWGSK
jgi:hypothetical protein